MRVPHPNVAEAVRIKTPLFFCNVRVGALTSNDTDDPVIQAGTRREADVKQNRLTPGATRIRARIHAPQHPAPNFVIPNRAEGPVRLALSGVEGNLLSCLPLNSKIYRRTSIYFSAGTPASTLPPFATEKTSSLATSANPSSPPVTCSPPPLLRGQPPPASEAPCCTWPI